MKNDASTTQQRSYIKHFFIFNERITGLLKKLVMYGSLAF